MRAPHHIFRQMSVVFLICAILGAMACSSTTPSEEPGETWTPVKQTSAPLTTQGIVNRAEFETTGHTVGSAQVNQQIVAQPTNLGGSGAVISPRDTVREVVVPVAPQIVKGQSGALRWELENLENEKKTKFPQIKQRTLVVLSNKGEEMNLAFGEGEALEVARPLVDGGYSWRVVETPHIEQRAMAALMEARESGDVQKEREVMAKLRAEGLYPTEAEIRQNVHTGHFTLQGGKVVSSALVETR